MSEKIEKLKREIYKYAPTISLPKGRIAGKYLFCQGKHDYQWASFISNKKRIYDRTGRVEPFNRIVFDACFEYSLISNDDFRNLKFELVDSLEGRILGASNNTIAIYNNKFFDNFGIR